MRASIGRQGQLRDIKNKSDYVRGIR